LGVGGESSRNVEMLAQKGGGAHTYHSFNEGIGSKRERCQKNLEKRATRCFRVAYEVGGGWEE